MLRVIRNLIVNVLASFIQDRNERRIFRNKYKIKSKFRKLRDDNIKIINENKQIRSEIQSLKKYIEQRFNSYINSFHDVNDLKYNNPDLRVLQQVNLILLNKFNRVCEKNNIEYWLDWGTLLGAVRHKGFIPWDDDLDVGMTRESFLKFEHVIKNEEDLILKYQYSVESVGHKIGKVDLKGIDAYIFLDIFIYDFFDINDEMEFQAYYKKKLEAINNELKAKRAIQQLNLNTQVTLMPNDKLNPIIDEPFKEFISYFDIKASGGGYLKNLTFGKDKNVLHRTSSVFPLSKVVFEGIQYPAPKNTDEYLKCKYGNYLSLPADTGSPLHLGSRSGYAQIQTMIDYLKDHNDYNNEK